MAINSSIKIKNLAFVLSELLIPPPPIPLMALCAAHGRIIYELRPLIHISGSSFQIRTPRDILSFQFYLLI